MTHVWERCQRICVLMVLLAVSWTAQADRVSLPFAPKTIHKGLPPSSQPVWAAWVFREGQSQPSQGTVILLRKPSEIFTLDRSLFTSTPRITQVYLSHPQEGVYDLGNPSFVPVHQPYVLSKLVLPPVSIPIQFESKVNTEAMAYQTGVYMVEIEDQRRKLAQQAKELIQKKEYGAAGMLFTELFKDSAMAVVAKMVLGEMKFEEMSAVAATKNGRLLLDLLYYGLVTKVADDALGIDGQFLKRTILAAKARVLHTPEDFAQRVRDGRFKVFPIKHEQMVNLSGFPSTLLRARLNWNGTVHVSYVGKIYPSVLAVFGEPPSGIPTPCETLFYSDDVKTFPVETCGRSGIDLPEDEIIGVRLYDRGGEIIPIYPLELIQLSETLLKSPAQANRDLAWLCLMVGTLLIPGAGEGAAAATVLPQLSARMASVLLWTDRVAVALGALTLLAYDQRALIESRFAERGKKFLRALDLLNGAVLLYGGARILHTTVLWVDFKMAYAEVRSSLQGETQFGNWLQRTDALVEEGEAAEGSLRSVYVTKDWEEFLAHKTFPKSVVTGLQTQAGPGATIAVNVVKNAVTKPEVQHLIQQVESKLRVLLEQAVAKVKANPKVQTLSPEAFGRQVHREFYKFLDAEQQLGTLSDKLVWNRGKAFPKKGLPHSYHVPGKRNPLRPDTRLSLSLPGGEEAVWDPTTLGQQGKARTYISFPHAQYVADLMYTR